MLQKDSLKTLSFLFLIQIDNSKDKLNDLNITTDQKSNLENIFTKLENKMEDLKTGIINRVIDDNLNKLQNTKTTFSVDECKKAAEEISKNIEKYNTSLQQSLGQMQQTFNAIKQTETGFLCTFK